MLTYFITGFLAGFPASAQPGPFQAYLLSQSLRLGWKRALPAALAPLLSDGPIILIVLLILTRLPVWSLNAIQVIGGLYILYLGWHAFQSYQQAKTGLVTTVEPDTHAQRQSVLQAALMNFLNPNPFIFWGTVGGPILLQSWRLSPLSSLGFLVGFYGALIGGFALFIIIFGQAGQLSPRAHRLLSGLSVLALLGFGLFLTGVGLYHLAIGYDPMAVSWLG